MADASTEQTLSQMIAESLRVMFGGAVLIGKLEKAMDSHAIAAANGNAVVVPLIGQPNYLVILCTNAEGGMALASAMFSCNRKLATQPMVEDSMCELANMVAGHAKGLLAREHQIGVPSVVTDHEILNGATAIASTRLLLGDNSSRVDVVLAKFEPPAVQPEEPNSEQQKRPEGTTIVLAEDDDVTLGFLKAVVQAMGLQVIAEARNGVQALHEIRRTKPDVVCLDINMPEMTGLEVLAAVRKEMPDAIVFLVSAFANADNVREAIRLRASGIIVKPFVKARITTEITRALAKRSQKPEVKG
jgi:two-component system, chemotaxis family, chemotaxis protein CheY